MSWSEFTKYEIVEIGNFKLLAGNLFFGIIVAFVIFLLISALRRIFLHPRFIIDKIDSKRRMSFFLISKYFIWIIGAMVILKVIGVDITILLFSSTAIFVAVGFGLQDIFKDLVAGLFLLFEGTLKIGDIIEANGLIGRVTELNLRSTQLTTRDNMTVVVPNSKFVVENFVNWSHEDDVVRFTVNVSVAYGSNAEEVIDVLEATMVKNRSIVNFPKPFVQFSDFGESALEFKMIFWSKRTFDIEVVKSDLRRETYQVLRDKNLAIPFPQRDVNIKGLDKFMDFKK